MAYSSTYKVRLDSPQGREILSSKSMVVAQRVAEHYRANGGRVFLVTQRRH